MGETRTIVNVRNLTEEGNIVSHQPVWAVEMSLDGGKTQTHAHIFPHELLSWRIAEYGIDPNDFDTLMDIAMHEPFMAIVETNPDFVYHVDEKTAREGHLARVAALKKQYTHLDPDGHLSKIRAAHDPNDPEHELRSARVRVMREDMMRLRAEGLKK